MSNQDGAEQQRKTWIAPRLSTIPMRESGEEASPTPFPTPS